MRQDGLSAQQGSRQHVAVGGQLGSQRLQGGQIGGVARECFVQVGHVGQAHGLVQRHQHARVVQAAQVDALARGAGQRGVGRCGIREAVDQGVEPGGVLGGECSGLFLHAGSQQPGHAVGAQRNAAQSFGAVVDGVEGRHVGQQGLGGADVAGGLVAADVLLARLQRHAVGDVAGGVVAGADDAARHGADELLAGGHEGGVRATEAQRDAEALGRADHHVGALGASRLQQHGGQRVGTYADLQAGCLQPGDVVGEVAHAPFGVGVLQVCAIEGAGIQCVQRAHRDRDLQPAGAGADHLDDLRMGAGLDEVAGGLAGAGPAQHGHRLGGRSGFVQQRGVGHLHAGEVDDHLLEDHQRFQAALRDLGLVGRVGCVPAGVLQHVATDRLGGEGAVVAAAQIAAPDLIAGSQLGQFGQRRRFGPGLADGQRGLVARIQQDAAWHGLGHQRIQRAGTDGGQHLRHVVPGRAHVTRHEFILSLCQQSGQGSRVVPIRHDGLSPSVPVGNRRRTAARPGRRGWPA